jgi:glycosyltransferase involved in cell wall biosynthesis
VIGSVERDRRGDIQPASTAPRRVRAASDLRVLIVAEHASASYGGEAVLPLHYFRLLRRRGVEAWLVVHARTQDELASLLPDEVGRIHFVPDTRLHRLLFLLGKPLPARVEFFSTGLLLRLLSQAVARRVARRLVAEQRIDVVHQPIPVSPREPSLLHRMGAPVVIGPMNGGMAYPPGFRRAESRFARWFTSLGRWASQLLHRVIPGKLRAETLAVANERTRQSLPRGVRGQVVELVENGVDLSLWPGEADRCEVAGPVRFAFAGRLVDWKGVDLLLAAFRPVAVRSEARLDIIGDGPMRATLEERAEGLGLKDSVTFHGWLPQAELARRLRTTDVFVLPSLYECGGAVVLEAMAAGLPVIATRWGGPTDYIDSECGILVDPSSPEAFVAGLSSAMIALADNPALRARLGRAGRERVVREFDWEQKVDRILEIYSGMVQRVGSEGGSLT